MQVSISHDRVSTGQLEEEVVKGVTALKPKLTFREGLFPLRKKSKVRPASGRKFKSVVCGRGHHIWRPLRAPPALSVWNRLNCSHSVINTSEKAVTGIQ